jgi:hypothetical protein
VLTSLGSVKFKDKIDKADSLKMLELMSDDYDDSMLVQGLDIYSIFS